MIPRHTASIGHTHESPAPPITTETRRRAGAEAGRPHDADGGIDAAHVTSGRCSWHTPARTSRQPATPATHAATGSGGGKGRFGDGRAITATHERDAEESGTASGGSRHLCAWCAAASGAWHRVAVWPAHLGLSVWLQHRRPATQHRGNSVPGTARPLGSLLWHSTVPARLVRCHQSPGTEDNL